MSAVLLFLSRYWLQLAGIAALAIALYMVHDYIGDQREDKVRAEYTELALKREKAHAAALIEFERKVGEIKAMHAELQSIAALRISALQNEKAALEVALAKAKKDLVSRGEVKPNENGTCPDTRLSSTFRLCWNAAVSRTPEAIEACGAGSLP